MLGLLAFRWIESQYCISTDKLAEQFATQITERGVGKRTFR